MLQVRLLPGWAVSGLSYYHKVQGIYQSERKKSISKYSTSSQAFLLPADPEVSLPAGLLVSTRHHPLCIAAPDCGVQGVMAGVVVGAGGAAGGKGYAAQKQENELCESASPSNNVKVCVPDFETRPQRLHFYSQETYDQEYCYLKYALFLFQITTPCFHFQFPSGPSPFAILSSSQ